MSEYNLTAEESDKLRFYGYDIQGAIRSKQRYLLYVSTVDPEKYRRDRAVIGCIVEKTANATISREGLVDAVRYIDLMI